MKGKVEYTRIKEIVEFIRHMIWENQSIIHCEMEVAKEKEEDEEQIEE